MRTGSNEGEVRFGSVWFNLERFGWLQIDAEADGQMNSPMKGIQSLDGRMRIRR